MDKNFIGERISELRLKKNVSEYQMSLDLGKNKKLHPVPHFRTFSAYHAELSGYL